VACVLFKSRGGFSPSAVTFLRQRIKQVRSHSARDKKPVLTIRLKFLLYTVRASRDASDTNITRSVAAIAFVPVRLQMLNIKMR